MNELIQAALEPVNFFYTILLGLVLLYWLSVIIGAMDINSFDLDMDVDIDIDTDIDTDVDANGGATVGWFTGMLQFFHIGRIPLIIVMSFSALTMWVVSIYVQQALGPSWGLALALFIPNVFAGLFVTKLITLPLLPVLENLDKGAAKVDYIGRECTLLLNLEHNEIGQAEVVLEDHTPLLVRVKLEEDSQGTLSKGAKALILRQETDRNCYWIKGIEND